MYLKYFSILLLLVSTVLFSQRDGEHTDFKLDPIITSYGYDSKQYIKYLEGDYIIVGSSFNSPFQNTRNIVPNKYFALFLNRSGKIVHQILLGIQERIIRAEEVSDNSSTTGSLTNKVVNIDTNKSTFYLLKEVIILTNKRLLKIKNNGSIDQLFTPNFSNVTNGITQNTDELYDIVIQKNSKILVSGKFNTVNNQSRSSLVRLNMDGTLDKIFQSQNVTFSAVYKLALDVKNKEIIYLIGTKSGIRGNRLYSLLENGEVNPNFSIFPQTDVNGFGISFYPYACDIEVDNDGKIIICAVNGITVSQNNISKSVGIIRFLDNGILDESYKSRIVQDGIINIEIDENGLIYGIGQILFRPNLGLSNTMKTIKLIYRFDKNEENIRPFLIKNLNLTSKFKGANFIDIKKIKLLPFSRHAMSLTLI